ncbi:MAG: hypothetical protein KDA31_06610 [Phycisphaerales bacterium]|nr:hypothetical protein [Phycisphaerales bacterium]MCB9836123.1 hypothetical protein [Phycisphaera sp.]
MGKAGGIIVALVIAAIAIGLKFSNKSEESDHTRQQVSELLHTLPDYDQAGPWYEGLVDTHHEAAFSHHYDIGGRRRSASFDQMAYIHELLDLMAADADRQNQKERAEYIRELRKTVYIDPNG